MGNSGSIVILYVILGAGAAVVMAAGVAYTLRVHIPEEFMSDEQKTYMREVREKNLEALRAVVVPRPKARAAPWS
jgi:hypothetical protein